VVGASHRTASAALRELLATEERELPAVYARLRGRGLSQFLWLSTCDRVEVQAVHPDPAAVRAAVTALFAERAGTLPAAVEERTYALTGEAAVRHAFAVASSLDSQVVGEPQVLGQVKAAHRDAAAAGTMGPELEALLQSAYAAAKRVRSETAVAERPVSIAAAAVQTARDVHGDLSRCSALLVGLADMGGLMIETLRSAGLGRVVVCARSEARAAAEARRHGGHFVPPADLDAALAGADVIVTATGSGRHLLGARQMEAALRQRRNRPVFVIDAAIPADVDPAVARLEHVFVYDLADLERIALAGRAGREAAAAAAWRIIEEAVSGFARGRAERAAVPALAALRRHFEATRARLLAEQPALDAPEATRLLVNRLLHRPSEVLKDVAGGGSGAELAQAERLLLRLFRLDGVEGATGTGGGSGGGCDEGGEK
jgi:glutamyl-tRNA reductase